LLSLRPGITRGDTKCVTIPERRLRPVEHVILFIYCFAEELKQHLHAEWLHAFIITSQCNYVHIEDDNSIA